MNKIIKNVLIVASTILVIGSVGLNLYILWSNWFFIQIDTAYSSGKSEIINTVYKAVNEGKEIQIGDSKGENIITIIKK